MNTREIVCRIILQANENKPDIRNSLAGGKETETEQNLSRGSTPFRLNSLYEKHRRSTLWAGGRGLVF
jgi:hypothetical protein